MSRHRQAIRRQPGITPSATATIKLPSRADEIAARVDKVARSMRGQQGALRNIRRTVIDELKALKKMRNHETI